MATKPIKFLELHYTMTQFLIIIDINNNNNNNNNNNKKNKKKRKSCIKLACKIFPAYGG